MDIFNKDSILKKKIEFGGIKDVPQKDLLTLILGKGVCTKKAVEISERILDKLGDIEKFSPDTIAKISNLTSKDKLFLEALIEFSTRIKDRTLKDIEIINTNEDIVKVFTPMIAHIPHEELWVVCLTSANRVIEKFILSKGTEQHSSFDIKLLMRKVLNNLSALVVLVHNHPSGDVKPSVEDKEITQDIVKALSYFDIVMLDHVILSKDENYSFRKNKDI